MATIPFDVFKQMINKEIANSAIEVFNQHGVELKNQDCQVYCLIRPIRFPHPAIYGRMRDLASFAQDDYHEVQN